MRTARKSAAPPVESPLPADDEARARAAQAKKNQAAIELLAEWMADESGYDEAVWPVVERALRENHLSFRTEVS